MGEKLRQVRETTSDAVQIVSMLSRPDVKDALTTIKETTDNALAILAYLKDPELQKNIQEMKSAAEAAQDAATKMAATVYELKESGILQEMVNATRSTRRFIEITGEVQKNQELIASLKETFDAIRDLASELKLAAASSRQSGAIADLQDTAENISKTYKTLRK
jgi:uncharacterized protein YjgD (DUF1641 family)